MRSGHHWPQRGRGPCRPEGCHSPVGSQAVSEGIPKPDTQTSSPRALPPYYSHATRGGSNQHAVSHV